MKKVLVTGGAGFIGSNFIQYIIENETDVFVINLDSLTYAGNLENLKSVSNNNRYKFIEGDIRDKNIVNQVFSEHEIDIVVHFAAESHVDRSIKDPSIFVETNVVGTLNLLEAARTTWMGNYSEKIFHHISTDEVYGMLTESDPAFTEETPYNPSSPYSASKASSDHLVRAYYHTFGLPVKITNCSNNYGPFQYPEKLIPVIIFNCIEGKQIPVYGDGKQIRDWLYVSDHCEAIWKIINVGKIGETYNIGGGNQNTNIEIVKIICNLLDVRLPNSPYVPHEQLISYVKDRQGHDRRYAMNIEKIMSETGWEPSQDIDSGLAKTVDWYLNNKEWIEGIKNKGDIDKWIESNYSKRG
ncbi:MAG: dTDP-glucose 4,6-dehydratase [Candidatus Heimdallarchaeota archaeon]|nr:dTDP-glucose 4,6-dehydratase [Candidatus Heimdallarchaeota archaeon]